MLYYVMFLMLSDSLVFEPCDSVFCFLCAKKYKYNTESCQFLRQFVNFVFFIPLFAKNEILTSFGIYFLFFFFFVMRTVEIVKNLLFAKQLLENKDVRKKKMTKSRLELAFILLCYLNSGLSSKLFCFVLCQITSKYVVWTW